MINHIVLMNLREQSAEPVADKLGYYAERIRNEIDQVRGYQIVPNIAKASQGFNWAIISSFDNESDMQVYKETALHKEFVAYCDPITEDILMLDYN
jgi:hypothetical protein